MNESEKTSLSQFYREHAHVNAPLPDADSLVSMALGERSQNADAAIAQVAASPLNGQLLHLTRALQPLSIDLSMDLENLLGRSAQSGSHRQARDRRAFGAQVRRRIAFAAMAASLIAVAGLWSTQRLQLSSGSQPTITAHAQPDSDHIFAGFNEKAVAAQNEKRGDEIFRGRFLPDEIFNANRHEG